MGKKARVVPQRRPTKRQLSRWEREKKLQRLILAGGAFAILLVLAVPLFGFAREYVFKGQEPVARVNQRVLTLSDYAQVLALRRYLLDAQIENLQRAAAQAGGQLQASLQNMEMARTALPTQVAEDWIQEQLVRQEAARLGLTVSPEEVTAAIRPDFDPIPGEAGEPKPLSEEEFRDRYQDFLNRARTTDARYRGLREWLLLAEKLEEHLRQQVQSPAPQVHLAALLEGTEEEARAALDRLGKGEDFAQVAREVSQDQESKEMGGDLGWVPRGLLDRELEEAAFSLQAGQVGRPIRAAQGFYVFQVLEREESRGVEPSILEQVRAGAFDRWLEEAQEKNRVERLLTSDKVAWAEKQNLRR